MEAITRELGIGAASDLDNIAVVLYEKGDLAGARRTCDEALALCREVGDRSTAAAVLATLGHALAAAGDLAGARAKYEEALPLLTETGNRTYAAIAHSGLGQVLAAEGDLVGARQKHDQALAIRTALGDKIGAAESDVALAGLSIEQGRPREAVAPLRAAAEVFRTEQATEKEGAAYSFLAGALLAQGRTAESVEVAGRARTLWTKGQNAHLRLSAAVMQARVRAANGSAVEALSGLVSALAEAAELGLVGAQLEARLAQGEIELGAGRAESGRARLATLEQEARAKGFGLVARKAASARARASR